MDDRGRLTERVRMRVPQPAAGPAEPTADHHQRRADEQREDGETVRERFHRVTPDLPRGLIDAQPGGDVIGAGDTDPAEAGVSAGDGRSRGNSLQAPITAARA